MTFLQQFTFIIIGISLLFSSCKNTPEVVSRKVKKASLPTTSKVGLRSPLYQSFDHGKTWQAIGHGIPNETQVSFLEKYDHQLVMATDNTGLFISDTTKLNWSSIGINLPSRKINSLHISEQAIYVGLFRKGIYYSSDAGINWLSLNFDLPNLSVNAILKTQTGVFVGTDYGIFQLKKETTNWELVSEKMQVTSFDNRGSRIIAGTNKGLLLSKNNGLNWDWMHRNGAIHAAAMLENTIVVMYISGDLFISKDWGNKWKEGNYSPKYASYTYDVATQTGSNVYILSNNYGVHQSTDGGANWQLIYKTEDKILYDFIVDKTVIYAGSRSWEEYRAKSVIDPVLQIPIGSGGFQ